MGTLRTLSFDSKPKLHKRVWMKIRDRWMLPIRKKVLLKFRRTAFIEIFEQMTRQNQCESVNLKLPDCAKYNWNIVFPDSRWGDYKKRFKRVHMFFKYRFFVPLIILAQKILGKHLVNEVPDFKYNKNFKVFDNAFEKMLRDWMWLYQRDSTKPIDLKNFTPEFMDKQIVEGKIINWMRIMKRVVLTICLNDTAYREMFNMLMHNIAIDMNKAHEKVIKHIFYKGDAIDESSYYYVYQDKTYSLAVKQIMDETHYKIKRRKDQLEQEVKKLLKRRRDLKNEIERSKK